MTNLQRHALPPVDGLQTVYVTALFTFNTPAAGPMSPSGAAGWSGVCGLQHPVPFPAREILLWVATQCTIDIYTKATAGMDPRESEPITLCGRRDHEAWLEECRIVVSVNTYVARRNRTCDLALSSKFIPEPSALRGGFSALQLQSWIQNVIVEVAHTVYIEAHIELEKLHCPNLFTSQKNESGMNIPGCASKLKHTRLAAGARSLKLSFTLNAPAINATAVILFLANQTADCTTGIRTFPWSSENAVPAILQDEHMSREKSKVVFKGSVVTPLAAGHLFHSCSRGVIGSEEGSEKPTLIEKMEYIGLLDGEKDESVVKNMVILSITWLLEPERGNVHFRKFSGTLEHPGYSDKQGAAINLFKHFTYIKTLVLADIQLPVVPGIMEK
ncbi:hypothetical protein DFH08DRAFT_828386 [Mycena albidolilacea]|uniref:Uncharacterized protein n=1 Tax=Mycena albidolilacea TaxID=1033008 RepID=A0AAD7E6B7_9AGAR|nr:hypothetical protein DFH08DRAFT_828386 [Mycena albidolilacea]